MIARDFYGEREQTAYLAALQHCAGETWRLWGRRREREPDHGYRSTLEWLEHRGPDASGFIAFTGSPS